MNCDHGDQGDFCRQVEGYLCRKNEGHLVRIVGPAFEQVRAWATRGVPLDIVFRGVDRYFERYYAKGPRRRPIRIEFCEADVLDVFDEWRRAVGVVDASSTEDETSASTAARPRESLAAHLDRLVARLTALRAGGDRVLGDVLDDIVRELDAARAGAKVLRGERREALLERLRILDGRILAAAKAACDAVTISRLTEDADGQLAAFRDRMAADAYVQSRQACLDRLIREHARLPTVAFD